MKSILFFSFIFLNLSSVTAQDFKQETLDSLYIESMKKNYALLIPNGHMYFEPNIITERIKSKFNISSFKFETQNELFKIAYKNNKSLTLYRVNHKIISKDTIDINIGEVYMTVKKGIFLKHGLYFKKILISIPCGGTNGYQPDFRYVFVESEKKWIIVSEKFVISE